VNGRVHPDCGKTRGAWCALILAFVCAAGAPVRAKDADPSATAHRGAGSDTIIDSRRTLVAERQAAIARGFPPSIVNRQALVAVTYLGFDGRIHRGQLLIDGRLANDIKVVFDEMLSRRFPVGAVVPISQFGWDDARSMKENNTSGFNYRKIKGTSRISNHAFGQAIDINPVQNPYINGRHVSPPGARYDPTEPGTLTAHSPLVKLFKARGWRWGGDWTSVKDYQHFEKVLR